MNNPASTSTEPYDDLIHLSRPISKTHPAMNISDRAAQFLPYATLTGQQDAVIENENTAENAELRTILPVDDY